jgi:hypothetical protein
MLNANRILSNSARPLKFPHCDALLNENSENKFCGPFSIANGEDDLLHRNLGLLNDLTARQCYE